MGPQQQEAFLIKYLLENQLGLLKLEKHFFDYIIINIILINIFINII